jgi:calcineurin-like phosphoesterase
MFCAFWSEAMKMFLSGLVLFVSASVPASADINFIPLGTGYSTDVDSVAPINSKSDQLRAATDIIESDLHRRAADEKRRDSYLLRFFSETERRGSDTLIDY